MPPLIVFVGVVVVGVVAVLPALAWPASGGAQGALLPAVAAVWNQWTV